jgi:HK97 family phage prohead protease
MSGCCDDPRYIRAMLARRGQGYAPFRMHRAFCGVCYGECRCTFDPLPVARALVEPTRAGPVCYAAACVSEASGRVVVRGLAARYETWSTTILEDGVRFREIISVGAFDAALRRRPLDIVVSINHDDAQELGRYRARSGDTARIWADREGLHYSVTLPSNAVGQRALRQLRNGELAGASFRFSEAESTFTDTPTGLVRRITSIGRLSDVTLAKRGAYSVGLPAPEVLTAA